MEIRLTDTEELSRHEYHTVEPGRVYYCPGRVLVVQADESALLILTDEKK